MVVVALVRGKAGLKMAFKALRPYDFDMLPFYKSALPPAWPSPILLSHHHHHHQALYLHLSKNPYLVFTHNKGRDFFFFSTPLFFLDF